MTARLIIDLYYGLLVGWSIQTIRITIKNRKPLVLLLLIVPALGWVFRSQILVTVAKLLEIIGFIN